MSVNEKVKSYRKKYPNDSLVMDPYRINSIDSVTSNKSMKIYEENNFPSIIGFLGTANEIKK